MFAVVFHAHQKIDRVAYQHLLSAVGGERPANFPTIKKILHFEGKNGPDATRLKNSAHAEQPWHFVNPFDAKDTELGQAIQYHYNEFTDALRTGNQARAAFEAAWLAHALVDGLTPAHHYPYEAALEDLRGEDRLSRTTIASHFVIKGKTARDSLRRSVKFVGPKGLLTTHTTFEAGVFVIMAPLKLRRAMPSAEDLAAVQKLGVAEYFQRIAREVAALGMYEQFMRTGWTPRLARIVRRELAPRLVLMVAAAWFAAAVDAGLLKTTKL